jgi:hypothetical protein
MGIAEVAMKPIAAIWHHPGTPPGVGAGVYPVAIVGFIQGPTLVAIVVDSTGRSNTAPVGELEIVDTGVRETVAAANSAIAGQPGR